MKVRRQNTQDRMSGAASHFIFCLLCAVFCILIHPSSYTADARAYGWDFCPSEFREWATVRG
jgi:hypothetical protein